jgi:NAD(P)-dependent dehydrogenase (short-subunit alcohol dehydrogenase family)
MTASVMKSADDTDFAAERIASKSPLGYAGFPEDIAAAALYLASDDARYVSGHTLVVDAGQTTAGMTPNRFHIGSSKQIHEDGRTS